MEDGSAERLDAASVLDGSFPYKMNGALPDLNPVTLTDSPNGNVPRTSQSYEAEDHFSIWLMYKDTRDGAVWVPLCKLDEWWWKGKISRVDLLDPDSNWQLDNSSKGDSGDFVDTYEFPRYATGELPKETPET